MNFRKNARCTCNWHQTYNMTQDSNKKQKNIFDFYDFLIFCIFINFFRKTFLEERKIKEKFLKKIFEKFLKRKLPNLSNKMNRQLSILEQSPATAPKTWWTKLWSTIIPGTVREAFSFHNSVQLNQQVYWVIQVIPYVSKGRSHRDCWYEASYGHLVNLS